MDLSLDERFHHSQVLFSSGFCSEVCVKLLISCWKPVVQRAAGLALAPRRVP